MATRSCADCGATSPQTQTQYTLIAKHGWRVIRTQGGGLQPGVEWRCAACWSTYKARQPGAQSTPIRLSTPPPSGSAPRGIDDSDESVEAGKLFDRALQALTTKPPNKR